MLTTAQVQTGYELHAMESDFLNVGQNFLEASVDEGTSSIDGVHGWVRRQLEGLQLHRQGWRSQKQESYQYKDNGNQNKSIPKIHFTRHHGAGLFFGGVKGGLRNLEEDFKLAIFPSCLGITVLGCPPLSEETPGVIAVV